MWSLLKMLYFSQMHIPKIKIIDKFFLLLMPGRFWKFWSPLNKLYCNQMHILKKLRSPMKMLFFNARHFSNVVITFQKCFTVTRCIFWKFWSPIKCFTLLQGTFQMLWSMLKMLFFDQMHILKKLVTAEKNAPAEFFPWLNFSPPPDKNI